MKTVRIVIGGGLAALLWAGCSGTGDGGPIVVTLLSIAVSPETVTIPAIGARFQLTVTGTRTDGSNPNLTADGGTTYSSRTPSVASVGAGGSVVAASAGTSVIIATNAGISDSVVVVVDPASSIAIGSLSILPASVGFTSLGESRSTTTTILWANGARFDGGGVPVAYASDDDAVATITGSGVIAPVGNGATFVRASAGGRSDSVLVTVTLPPPIGSLDVVPSEFVLPAVGARFQLVVSGTTSTGIIDLTADPTTAYTSRDQSVATAVSGGSVVAAGPGATYIVAAHSGLSDSVFVTVDAGAAIGITTLSITPESVDFTAIGQTRGTTTSVLWENGARFDGGGAPIAYTTGNAAVATVSTSGVITAAGVGSTQVAASLGAAGDTVDVTVSVPAVSFAAEVLPVLASNCTFVGCHAASGGQRNLRLNSRANLMAGTSTNGPVVMPGDGAGSLVIRVLRGSVGSPVNAAQMPKGRTPLSGATIDEIKAWIDQGALDN